MNRYIAFDCETGGLDSKKSLLTAYFVVLDSDLVTVLGELDLKIKPDSNESYSVTAEALAINKINLVEHDKVAVTMSVAAKQLYNFIQLHSLNGKTKLIPVGQNVVFDESFIQEHLISKNTWEMFVSYRRIDTGTIAEFLRLTGHIPSTVRGSLISIADFLDVSFPDAHNAKNDTIATVKVLKKMKKMVEKQ